MKNLLIKTFCALLLVGAMMGSNPSYAQEYFGLTSDGLTILFDATGNITLYFKKFEDVTETTKVDGKTYKLVEAKATGNGIVTAKYKLADKKDAGDNQNTPPTQ